MIDTILIRTSEICLKGGNRRMFETRLTDNIRERVAGLGAFSLKQRQGSFILRRSGPMDDILAAELSRRLRTVFGISHFLWAARCAASVEAMAETAAKLLSQEAGSTFKVETRRSDKTFPLRSPEISRLIGGHLLKTVAGRRVDVHSPNVRLQVEVDKTESLIAARRIEGWGGLPVGTAGKVMVLLSGGIDSPVAAWKTLRRGCRASFVHFHSYPFVGRHSIDKVKRLVRTLNDYQSGSTLYLVPFADAQRGITEACAPSLRIILYRRLMMRIAEAAARAEGALGLVTGDSIGQVASQTLENMAAVSAVAGMPIYRPLIGENKEDIAAWAKEVGTYDISIEPHDDCCSLFQPLRPATKTTAAAAEREEAKYPAEELASAAWKNAEKTVVSAKTWDVETAGTA